MKPNSVRPWVKYSRSYLYNAKQEVQAWLIKEKFTKQASLETYAQHEDILEELTEAIKWKRAHAKSLNSPKRP